eukprot:862923-Prorocentrum_minimum.AAC.1
MPDARPDFIELVGSRNDMERTKQDLVKKYQDLGKVVTRADVSRVENAGTPTTRLDTTLLVDAGGATTRADIRRGGEPLRLSKAGGTGVVSGARAELCARRARQLASHQADLADRVDLNVLSNVQNNTRTYYSPIVAPDPSHSLNLGGAAKQSTLRGKGVSPPVPSRATHEGGSDGVDDEE